jgi:hypothetical protein
VKLRSASGKNNVVASIKTTKTGGWEIATQLPAGSFYAQVPKVSKQGKQHGHKVKLICSGAKTKTVTI